MSIHEPVPNVFTLADETTLLDVMGKPYVTLVGAHTCRFEGIPCIELNVRERFAPARTIKFAIVNEKKEVLSFEAKSIRRISDDIVQLIVPQSNFKFMPDKYETLFML